MKESEAIVFFDGVCNLCNSSVDFIIKHDKESKFKFASLQSHYAKTILNIENESNFDSVILYQDNKIYNKSTAALKIAKELSSFTKLLYIFIIVPKPIRDIIYNIIAKNRYRWFGKIDTCRIPTTEEKELFKE